MLRFQNSLPDEDADFPFHLLRTPPAGPLTGIITTPKLLSCKTHFAKNRTSPCMDPDPCELCNDGFSWRWHVYVGLFQPRTFHHVIFETTPRAAKPLEHYLTFHQTLRSAAIKSTRPSANPNGRIHIDVKHIDEATLRLPPPPDVEKILCHIWNIQNNLNEDILTSRTHHPETLRPDPQGNGRSSRPN